jgi:ubiquitin carboxyl-terminal hydrolase L5
VQQEVNCLQAVIAEEEEKRRRYKIENVRRRHNYIPFIVELLKILAREGKLVPLTEKAIVEAKKKAAAKSTQTGAGKKK